MLAYYNEINSYACKWLTNLIRLGLITNGDVDCSDIRNIPADELIYRQTAHFFAGIGGWAYALKLANWPSEIPVWTGSCPCQPFSQAGKTRGFADSRHLWPTWFDLIRQCNPPIVFGEQVANGLGLDWLDAVSTDLESANYEVGAADLCAASVGAPHVRQRLFFMAVTRDKRRDGLHTLLHQRRPLKDCPETSGCSPASGMGNSSSSSRSGRDSRTVSQPKKKGLSQRQKVRSEPDVSIATSSSFWSNAEWISTSDGKYRPIESGTFPLAHGVPARVGKLRAYGNAIVPQVAATFIQAAMNCI